MKIFYYLCFDLIIFFRHVDFFSYICNVVRNRQER